MKKQVSAILAAGMAASLLVGCGGAASSAASSTAESTSTAASSEAAAATTEAGQAADITLWTYPIGKWGDSESVDALLADFNAKYPDIHVTVEYLDYTNGDDQVNTAIEGGSAPDLVMEGPERLVANWGAKGLMVDLSDLWTDDQKADISASVEAACKDSSGAYYEFPLCMTAHCMAINKTVFEAAGAMQYVDAENHTWTTENFLKAVQAVYDSGKTDVGALYCSGQGGDQGTRALVNNLYGGTFTQFRISLRRLGIDCRIARSERPEDFEALIDGRTKAIYAESMGNPTCTVPDLEALGQLAKRYDVPFVADNTFGAAGYLCNPFEWGANIVVDSATKWINGHGTAMGGVIVDGGNYNWANGKFPQIDGPSEGYHGLNFHEAFGAAAFIVKCRVDGVRDLGCCPSPFDSYLMTLGLETLSLRVRHEVESARRLAEYCRNHPKVERVSFVGFESHPSYANAKKYFRFGSSAVFTIELKGTLDSTVRFVESLNLAAHMVMIGDSVTVVTHPASTTHKQLSDADLAAAGVTPTMLRISVGLENTDDLIDDFEQAFAHIG